MIRLRQVTKEYATVAGVAVRALDGIDLNLPDRGLIFLVGRSGCGKTTLLNLLGGLDEPTAGTIRISGRPLSGRTMAAYRNRAVGFVFQEYNLIEEMTVGENLAFALELQRLKPTAEPIEAALNRVGLESVAGKYPRELSGGQRQRVAIARALIKEPQLILADEPTGALDRQTGQQIFELLRLLAKDRLVVVVSHDRAAAERYADRILEMEDGKLIGDTVPMGDEPIREAPLWVSARLPMGRALRMAWRTLMSKKLRIGAILLLSVAAFVLVGMADVFAAYESQTAFLRTMEESGRTYLSLRKEVQDGERWSRDGYMLTPDDLTALSEKTGLTVKGVYAPPQTPLTLTRNYQYSKIKPEERAYVVEELNGFMELTDADLAAFGFSLVAGWLPDGNGDEIALSRYVFESFMRMDYSAYTGPQFRIIDNATRETRMTLSWDEYRQSEYRTGIGIDESDHPEWSRAQSDSYAAEWVKIKKPEDLIGKTVFFGERNYTVVGIVDTYFNAGRYEQGETEQTDGMNMMGELLDRELEHDRQYSLACVAFVGEGKIAEIRGRYPNLVTAEGLKVIISDDDSSYTASYIARLSDVDLSRLNLSMDGALADFGMKDVLVPAVGGRVGWTGEGSYYRAWLDREGLMLQIEQTDRASRADTGYAIVGKWDHLEYYDGWRYPMDGVIVLSDLMFDTISRGRDGLYFYAVMPAPTDVLAQAVEVAGTPDEGVRYAVVNAVNFEVKSLNTFLNTTAQLFRYVGWVMVAFACMMVYNFVAMNLLERRRSIGIMRALGAGGRDLLRMIGSETLILGLVTAVLACTVTAALVPLGNRMLQEQYGIMLNVLYMDWRQIVPIVALSLMMTAVGGLLPTWGMIRRRPAEAMK